MVEAKTKRVAGLLPVLLIFAAGLFLTGISWGLPSRAADPFLFGNRTPWTGQEILALAPDWGGDANRAADVAAHPLSRRDQPIVLNQTDAQRAAIVRRYRLYSDQPDEMITLRALAQMKPGKLQLDPKLYQYGGLWVYPIGGLVKIASLLHLVRVTADLAFYLDHPEAFGRLYVIMRLYSVAWGLAGVVVMFKLAKRITGCKWVAATAAICYSLLPTVINGAHEAKPHLAGAVLGLIAVDFAIRAIESRQWRWMIATGIACGAAASMVLSGWLVLSILPVTGFFAARRQVYGLAQPGRAGISSPASQPFPAKSHLMSCLRRTIATTAASCAVAVLIYAICNPYVILHLLGNRALLQSNLENSAAMYQAPPSLDGVLHGVNLLTDGGSTTIFFGVLVIAFLAWRKAPIAWLIIAATLPGIVIFVLHATGKPGEYARFAIAMDVLWVAAAALAMEVFNRTAQRGAVGVVLILMLFPLGISYLLNYGRETFGEPTRLIVAQRLRAIAAQGATELAIDAEPAPYALPPVDLFNWRLLLLPRGAAMPDDADVRIDPVDRADISDAHLIYFTQPMLLPTPISWAAKPFRVFLRTGVVAGGKGDR